MVKDVALKTLPQIEPSKIERLGIDEIAWVKGQKNYLVVLVDLDTKKPIAFVNSRRKEDIGKVLKSWGEKVLSKIQEVSIDLYKGYKILTEELMPQAEIIADRFHVMKLLNKELGEARRQEKIE
ncbi:MAG: transposase [Oscillatoria sp. SIO1A7]|nr:transposase [Oscillatoria sp. SIO1A7]